LRGFLLGREFKSGGKEVIVQDVIMTGVKGYALICLDLIGSYQGRVYVYGRPQYDTSTSTVSIEDLDFDLSTKNIVHNAANWMLHGSILSGVKPYLKFPLREKLLESQLMVQKTLSHAELMKNVYIVGSIDSLKVGGVRLTDNAIRATVFAKGAMQLSVHE
jgi:predicted RNA-binding protein